ncbi:hypothetical protein [Nocardia iowensis]|uniref:hypothetical protein n=1 Tax=Nocardia iowensis TaxID=204891 RepID=UPI003383F219
MGVTLPQATDTSQTQKPATCGGKIIDGFAAVGAVTSAGCGDEFRGRDSSLLVRN